MSPLQTPYPPDWPVRRPRVPFYTFRPEGPPQGWGHGPPDTTVPHVPGLGDRRETPHVSRPTPPPVRDGGRRGPSPVSGLRAGEGVRQGRRGNPTHVGSSWDRPLCPVHSRGDPFVPSQKSRVHPHGTTQERQCIGATNGQRCQERTFPRGPGRTLTGPSSVQVPRRLDFNVDPDPSSTYSSSVRVPRLCVGPDPSST